MKQRLLNCDILRIIAFIFVVAVHFLLYTDFYYITTEGPTMYIINILRCLFITCVPLFIILTGYLMNKKEISKEYYKKITRVIIPYILCSIICIISIHFILDRDVLTLKEYIFEILGFGGAPYAWYVNMYLGLYLLIPFLNILWNNLKTKENKKALIITLFILIVLPTILNIFNFIEPNWFTNPQISKNYQMLVPNYWSGITYPIIYYFVGCYLKEYPIKISIYKNILILILLIILFGTFNYYRNFNGNFDFGIYADYYSFEVFFISLLLSNLILNLKINIKNKLFNKFISKLSYLTFGAYLLSAIFDNLIYKVLNSNIYLFKEKCYYMIPIILSIVCLSLISSYIVDLIEKMLKKIYSIIKSKCLKRISTVI